MQSAPGKGLLKVVGILFIIFGAISIIVALLGIAGGLALSAISGILGATLIVGTIIACLGGIMEFIAGIYGVRNCDKPEKATTCVVLGIIILVLSVISLIVSSFSWTSLFSIALPILYLIGAFQNKKAV